VAKILQTDAQPYWRAAAARLLERWTDEPSVVSALIQELAYTNALVRQSAAQTLAATDTSGSPEIREALTRCLSDPSPGVRVTAAQALASGLDLNSQAGKDLLRMLDHNADQPAGQMQLGLFALARGEVTNALQHFQTAAQWDAYSPVIRSELAVVFSQLGRAGDAVKELQEAVRLAPNDAEFHFKLGLAWNELGESAKARAELEMAVKLNPKDARAQYNLGLARNAAGDADGAIQALLAAESADPRDPRIPYARATIHAHLGQLREAREAVRRALELNPAFGEAQALLQQLPDK
jgi:Flp pilus assembly protein TadD